MIICKLPTSESFTSSLAKMSITCYGVTGVAWVDFRGRFLGVARAARALTGRKARKGRHFCFLVVFMYACRYHLLCRGGDLQLAVHGCGEEVKLRMIGFVRGACSL